MIHPRYLFATLDLSVYEAYRERNHFRSLQSYKAMSDMMINNSLVKLKEAPPYTPEVESQVLLNSLARASLSPKTGQHTFTKLSRGQEVDLSQTRTMIESFSDTSSTAGVGVDQGLYTSPIL
jgi:fatty acid synthase subunit alpha, fungi type